MVEIVRNNNHIVAASQSRQETTCCRIDLIIVEFQNGSHRRAINQHLRAKRRGSPIHNGYGRISAIFNALFLNNRTVSIGYIKSGRSSQKHISGVIWDRCGISSGQLISALGDDMLPAGIRRVSSIDMHQNPDLGSLSTLVPDDARHHILVIGLVPPVPETPGFVRVRSSRDRRSFQSERIRSSGGAGFDRAASHTILRKSAIFRAR